MKRCECSLSFKISYCAALSPCFLGVTRNGEVLRLWTTADPCTFVDLPFLKHLTPFWASLHLFICNISYLIFKHIFPLKIMSLCLDENCIWSNTGKEWDFFLCWFSVMFRNIQEKNCCLLQSCSHTKNLRWHWVRIKFFFNILNLIFKI